MGGKNVILKELHIQNVPASLTSSKWDLKESNVKHSHHLPICSWIMVLNNGRKSVLQNIMMSKSRWPWVTAEDGICVVTKTFHHGILITSSLKPTGCLCQIIKEFSLKEFWRNCVHDNKLRESGKYVSCPWWEIKVIKRKYVELLVSLHHWTQIWSSGFLFLSYSEFTVSCLLFDQYQFFINDLCSSPLSFTCQKYKSCLCV